jgi:hypothetical protein
MSVGTKGAAKSKEMGALHDQLAKELRDLIKNGEEVTVRGKTKKVKASAAILNVARAFLKDNNVLCDDGMDPTQPMVDLATELKEFNKEEEDGAPVFRN